MPEALHAWALAPTALGTCCLIAARRRVRVSEIAASVLMLLAMLDTALPGQVLAPVFWAVLLIVGAIGIAAVRRVRSRAAASSVPAHSRADPALHTTLGLVVMAALLLGMPGHGATGGHAHTGMGPTVLIIAAVAYIAASVVSAVRSPRWWDRTQFGSMGLSTLLMTLAMID